MFRSITPVVRRIAEKSNRRKFNSSGFQLARVLATDGVDEVIITLWRRMRAYTFKKKMVFV